MITVRWTETMKEGREAEAVKVLKEAMEPQKYPIRICTCRTEPSNTIAMEIDYESLAEYEKAVAEWQTTEQAAVFGKKWPELVCGNEAHEVWNLAE